MRSRVLPIGALLCGCLLSLAAQADPPPAANHDFPKSDSLDLESYLALVYAHHPALAAGRSEVAAKEAARLQTSLGANPEISLEVEDFGGTGSRRGFAAAQTTVQASQTLELGGKGARRERVAAAEKRLAEADLKSMAAEIRAQARATFLEALSAHRRLALAWESKALTEKLLEAVEHRVREGAASLADAMRARFAVTEAGMKVRQDSLRVESWQRKLARLGGRETFSEPFQALPPLRDRLDSLAPLPSWDSLREGLGQTPEAASLAGNIALAEARLARESGHAYPDITLNAGLRHASSGEMTEKASLALVGGLSLPLPIRNRNRDGREEARQGIARAKAERQASAAATLSALEDSHGEARMALDEIATLRDSLIPDATKAASILEDGYRRGRFALREVLDADAELFRARLRLLECMLRYQLGYAGLERLAGPLGKPAQPPSGEAGPRKGGSR